jgi:hypothetical protein
MLYIKLDIYKLQKLDQTKPAAAKINLTIIGKKYISLINRAAKSIGNMQ